MEAGNIEGFDESVYRPLDGTVGLNHTDARTKLA
jgi:hypothetical protein